LLLLAGNPAELGASSHLGRCRRELSFFDMGNTESLSII